MATTFVLTAVFTSQLGSIELISDAISWSDLLSDESVQKEVGLSPQLSKKIRSSLLRIEKPSQKTARLQDELNEDQFRRLREIHYQVLGLRAVYLDEVANLLQLTESQQHILRGSVKKKILERLDRLSKERYRSPEALESAKKSYLAFTEQEIEKELTNEKI